MKKFVVLATLALAGCTTGQAEFAALPGEGPLTQAKLLRAQGYCKMRYTDEVRAQMVVNGFPEVTSLADDAKACFASQGVLIKGWRQDDGSLTSYPIKPVTPMAARRLNIEGPGKFPPKPKKG